MRNQVRCWQRQGVKEGLASFTERNASKPILACTWGEVAKSADAQYPNTLTCYNGRIRKQDSLLNEGSLYFRSFFSRTKQKQVERQGFVKDVKVADEPVVVIKSEPMKLW